MLNWRIYNFIVWAKFPDENSLGRYGLFPHDDCINICGKEYEVINKTDEQRLYMFESHSKNDLVSMEHETQKKICIKQNKTSKDNCLTQVTI